MSWIAFALATALFESLKDLSARKSLDRVHPVLVSWAATTFALPILALPLSFATFPEITWQLLATLFCACGLHLSALVLYMKAIQLSPLSLSLPMISFTPVFLLLTSPIMIGELPGRAGILGICLIVCGAYLLHVQTRHRGPLEPFRALASEKGSRLMLLVAFIWSISGNLDRVGLSYANRQWWVFLLIAGIAVGNTLVILRMRSVLASSCTKTVVSAGVITGLFNGLSAYCYINALSFTLVAYVVSIKRLSILLGTLWGYLFFQEENIRQRLIGSLVMLIGLVLITLSA